MWSRSSPRSLLNSSSALKAHHAPLRITQVTGTDKKNRILSASNLPLATRLPYLSKGPWALRPYLAVGLPFSRTLASIHELRTPCSDRPDGRWPRYRSLRARPWSNITPLEGGLDPTACGPNLSKDLSVGFRRPVGADLGRKNPRSGSEFLRSDALAMHGRGSAPRYLKPFAHLSHQVCCLPISSLQPAM